MPATRFDESVLDRPHPLLTTTDSSDFSRNFHELQKHAKRPYSLTRVLRSLLRSFCTSPPRLDGFEAEVDEELRSNAPREGVDYIPHSGARPSVLPGEVFKFFVLLA